MTKFELYERLWSEMCQKDLFLVEKTYTEEEYQLYKQLFEENFAMTTTVFSEINKKLKNKKLLV